MKRLLVLLAAAGTLAFGAMTAQAAQYPPGPSGTCTDTLTIEELQVLPPVACSPAAGDTVYGVRGVVTGFDKDFSPPAPSSRSARCPPRRRSTRPVPPAPAPTR